MQAQNIQASEDKIIEPEGGVVVNDSKLGPEAGKGQRTNKEWKQLLAFPSDQVVENFDVYDSDVS